MRVPGEIGKAMAKATSPTFAISAKLNSADLQRGGFSPEDSVLVAQALEAAGPVVGHGHRVTGVLEGVADANRQGLLVFDDEDAAGRCG